MCVWCWPDRARAHCEAIRRLKELLVTPRSALPVPRHHRPQCRGTERCSRASLKPLLGPPVDQRRLRAAHRVCPVVSRIKPDFLDPGIDDVGVLPGSQRASLGKQALARSRVTRTGITWRAGPHCRVAPNFGTTSVKIRAPDLLLVIRHARGKPCQNATRAPKVTAVI